MELPYLLEHGREKTLVQRQQLRLFIPSKLTPQPVFVTATAHRIVCRVISSFPTTLREGKTLYCLWKLRKVT